MESNELRIGNLVHDYDEELIIVSGISYGDVYSSKLGETPLARIKPIPLTEEWLVKFGFEKFKNPNNTPNWIWFINKHSWVLQSFEKQNEFYQLNGIKPINYIHQLQNLYFALTGEELNIK
jgi:hypothetical protein